MELGGARYIRLDEKRSGTKDADPALVGKGEKGFGG